MIRLSAEDIEARNARNKAAWAQSPKTELVSLADIFSGIAKPVKAAKPSKYRNVKHELDGQVFDSKREMKHWANLTGALAGGLISDLQRQVKYVLIPSQTRDDGTKERPVTYTADFVYTRDGKTVVADAKGITTQQGIIRRKLMLMVHGITVKEI